MDCAHKFTGHADGVTCQLCGLRMTTDEYVAYLNTPEEKRPVKQPTRARKKKEASAHERV